MPVRVNRCNNYTVTSTIVGFCLGVSISVAVGYILMISFYKRGEDTTSYTHIPSASTTVEVPVHTYAETYPTAPHIPSPPVFTQLGYIKLSSEDVTHPLLPLYGGPSILRKDRWNYYTVKEGIKLPIIQKSGSSRDCMEEIACDQLYNGDTVFIDGWEIGWVVRLY